MRGEEESGMVKVLGICGSLRKGSYNRMALAAAEKLAPEGMTIDRFDLRPIPVYDDDVRVAGFPEPVQALRRAIAEADAVLFVSPEYNFSIPGVLKNAIDWASRPPDQPLNEKPVAMMGCSPGPVGTTRMQYHLRQVMVFVNAHPLNKPEVAIGNAAQRFDANGNLTDETTAGFVRQLLEALAAWTQRLKAR
jgi:chromate reductase, NAD(P)H dehydrogenase (quinone)